MISRPLGAPFAFDDENVSSGTTTFCRRADHSQRIGGANVFGGSDLPAIAVDFDLEVRGREIGHLAPVRIERGDVNGDELDAGAENWVVGPGAWGLGLGFGRWSVS